MKSCRRNEKRTLKFFLLWSGLILFCVFSAASVHAATRPIRVGILPVLDTLPLQVAVQEGFFKQHGLHVRLVSFNSALERDAAIQGGQLEGYFGDLLNTLLLVRNGIPIRIVTVSYRSTPGQRMFGLVGRPGLQARSVGDLQKAVVGLSNATIMEFLLDAMQEKAGVPRSQWKRLEVKKIPIRFQMLLAGQLDLALLPEPLISLAETKGARTFITDESLNLPLTVVCLHTKILDASPESGRGFLAAYEDAVRALSAHPEKYRDLMARWCRIPKPLVSSYPIPEFPVPALPSEKEVGRVQRWMHERGLIQEKIPYSRLVWKGGEAKE